MIHVLSVIHYPVFGGPHNRNMRITPILEQLGVRNTVLLPDDQGNAKQRLIDAGIEVVTMPLHRVRASLRPEIHYDFCKSFSKEVQAIRKLILDLQVDVIQLNGLINPHAAIAARAVGRPVVWQILDTATPTFIRPVMRRLVKKYANVVMSTGSRVAEDHLGSSWPNDNLVIFYPPVDLEKFSASEAVRGKIREKLGLSDNELVVGTLGNMNRQKGHENFVKAAAELKKLNKGTIFIMFGATHRSQPDKVQRLIELAGACGLTYGKDIRIIDPGTSVDEYLQALDVFWMTPRPKSEGIPTAMEEAMALQLPVVSFDVGSISELVMDGSSGYVVKQQSPRRVSDITADHLLSRSIREKMGAHGRRIVEEKASIDRCANIHWKAYAMALGYPEGSNSNTDIYSH